MDAAGTPGDGQDVGMRSKRIRGPGGGRGRGGWGWNGLVGGQPPRPQSGPPKKFSLLCESCAPAALLRAGYSTLAYLPLNAGPPACPFIPLSLLAPLVLADLLGSSISGVLL